jgi:methionine salvage enolase-phosphatase E1
MNPDDKYRYFQTYINDLVDSQRENREVWAFVKQRCKELKIETTGKSLVANIFDLLDATQAPP